MIVNPGKEPITESEAIILINSFNTIFVAKGKKLLEYKTIHDDKQEIIKAAIGRTGNLRAPTVQCEDTIFIGYNNRIYRNFGQ